MGSGGLFPADDVVELAAQLKSFASDSAGSWRAADAAQTHARTHFEPGAVARQTVEVYRAVVGAGAEKMDGTRSWERTSLPASNGPQC